ncbi:uncharacterized protein F5Z01DRAFT_117880 [Emericellopsis atlantica]|uniref:Uncharacterized protein n=1 Tax=Emericellopsis atlantica TaxID=2614577 RepID=A0A9P7ZL52_9HYPO|nr:uncharacterized protein F5Z01DRAFT_117880 [Emericellopsis atlantica]KAG9254124.1 hypothetical protein F5Z01DRAFT_117880 [Emericellopsis atlantica]
MSSFTKAKAGISAIAFGAVITVGSLTGAQLKADKQKADAIREFRETSPHQQIAVLEEQKRALLDTRGQLQRKIDLFEEKVKEREAEKARRRAIRAQRKTE